jgi:hypothetical protein
MSYYHPNTRSPNPFIAAFYQAVSGEVNAVLREQQKSITEARENNKKIINKFDYDPVLSDKALEILRNDFKLLVDPKYSKPGYYTITVPI